MMQRAMGVTLLVLGLGSGGASAGVEAPVYSPAELRTLRSLWIGSLGQPPDDPSNAYDTDPRAAALGRRIFFDTRFSANGTLACVTCHQPAASFQDGKPVSEGLGRLARRSMPLLGVAHNSWFFWDGRKDSLWSQALAPLEHPLELGLTRTQVSGLMRAHYRADYETIFGPLPHSGDAGTITRVFVNVGKALAAFVRTIQPGPARFDGYVEALLSASEPKAERLLAPAEIRGLRLFIGRAKCINCHAGPRFTNGEFHFTRVPQPAPDAGRADVITKVRADEFNCTSRYSDAKPEQCSALRFIDADTRETLRAFKTPTLRNVAVRAPYMNAGQFATLAEVLRFYRDQTHGMKELAHGDLRTAELGDLEAFLGTLTGPVAALGAE
jgi:cytochrome c peroxidase